MTWEYDYQFTRFAVLLWPELFDLADSQHGTKGRAEARRIMAERHRGFRAFVELTKLADDIASLRASLPRAGGAA